MKKLMSLVMAVIIIVFAMVIFVGCSSNSNKYKTSIETGFEYSEALGKVNYKIIGHYGSGNIDYIYEAIGIYKEKGNIILDDEIRMEKANDGTYTYWITIAKIAE